MFEPIPSQSLQVQGLNFIFDAHPSVPLDRNFVYAQEGRKGIIYRLHNNSGEPFALKLFKSRYRGSYIDSIAVQSSKFSSLPGMIIAKRMVITQAKEPKLVYLYPSWIIQY